MTIGPAAATSGRASVTEPLLAGAAGALLGATVGALVAVPIPAAIVGGLNGALSGRHNIYDWSSKRGVGAFALDSTWALATTAAGLFAHVAGAVRGDAGFSAELSERKNRFVYSRGFQPRRGFATTVGNVVGGAGDLSRARRAKLVTDHEDVHVWQARWFGPTYPLLYFGWMVGGGAAGMLIWLARRRSEPFTKVVESCAYYLNPFEYWAYSRDDHWPPTGMLERLGPQRPIVRSFASIRASG